VGERVLYTKAFPIMGGGGVIEFIDERGPEAAESIARRAIDEADRIERKYSRYLPDSVVSRIIRDAGRTPVAVDSETTGLVRTALDLAERTAGAFDPTSGVLRRVWNFRERRVPDRADVEAILPLVDYRQVSLRDGTVFLRRAGMEIDLGGVGKEYAADRVAEILLAERAVPALVNLGGDVRTLGARGDGHPWRIGVQDPRDRDRCRFSVRLMGDAGVATSGDYERFFVIDGVRYHHLLDARTGMPARGVASVTVVGPTAFKAGLAATTAFLLGAEAGLASLEASPGIEGAVITEAGAVETTTGMWKLSDLPGSIFADYPGI